MYLLTNLNTGALYLSLNILLVMRHRPGRSRR